MAIFDKFKKKEAPAPEPPEAVAVEAAPDTLYSPAKGRVIRMTDVPDRAFSSEVLGKGCGVWTDIDEIYAPVSGWVESAMAHSVTINSDEGLKVLVHVGINTVTLEGRGFHDYVKEGDRVVAGQPIIHASHNVIAEAGLQDCVVVAISNSDELADVELAVDFSEEVEAGAPVLKVTRK